MRQRKLVRQLQEVLERQPAGVLGQQLAGVLGQRLAEVLGRQWQLVLGRQQQLVLGQRRQLVQLRKTDDRAVSLGRLGTLVADNLAGLYLPTTAALLMRVAAGSFGSTPGSLVWIEARKPAASAT